MMKRMKWSVVVVFLAVLCTGAAALLVPRPVSAAGGSCWQVDCNICCKTGKGPVICTQRACV